MNPLFLLLGLFGVTAGSSLFGRSSTNETTTTTDAGVVPIVDSGPDKTPPVPETATPTVPVVETPVQQEPDAQEPVVQEPVVQEPEQQEPVVQEPVAQEPEQQEPVVQEPVAQEPEQQEPVVQEPVAQEPEPQEPVVQEPVAQEPEQPANTPTAPEQTGSGGSDGADTTPIAADGTVDVIAGRVTTLQPGADDIVSVSISSDVQHGTITVNPDNSLALVMTQSGFTGSQSFTYEATHSDGSTSLHQVGLNVTAGPQAGGWGTGETHYMLETDEDDRVIVETGENHIKVHISGASDALSIADIAAREGVSQSSIDGNWLAARDYGQTEDLALAEDAGWLLWKAVAPPNSQTSNWLLLERGYEYDDAPIRILSGGTHGENELNPLYMGAFGEGEKPVITTAFNQLQESTANLVVQDIHFTGGVYWLGAENVIFDNITVSENKFSVQQSDSITIRNSEFIDVFREASINGGNWEAHLDRISGLYSDYVDGLLLEGNLFDHNGWEDGYYENLSGSGGQPPSMYSQNIYLNANITDVTMRDTITMQSASFGAQIRSGGFVEDNVFLDNNAGFITVGGDYEGAGPVGQYSLITDNLVTSASHKLAQQIGAKSIGLEDRAVMSSLVDNIIAHLADPNSDELDWKTTTDHSLLNLRSFYDDSIVYNWEGSGTIWNDAIIREQNVDTLDTSVLDQTTIQIFTAQLLGDSNATISDLADYLRANADGELDGQADADLIIDFFQAGFGIAPDVRDTAETLRFVPDDLGDGVRWDNRLNWDTEDLPGFHAGDSVDLGGNHVVYGTNTTINTLDMGPGGALNVYGGHLELTGGITGDDAGTLEITGSGQVWSDGSNASDLDINIDGGRFANTGTVSGADLTATGGQTILATGGAEYNVAASKTLAVFEAAAQVGFDGDNGGIAVLDMDEGATLAFSAQDGDLGSIEEFRSGAYGDAPDVQSGIDLGGADLSINLSGLNASAGTAFTLMDADELIGVFNDASVSGLGARDARIVVDYENDSVTLQLSSGNGAVSVDTIGAQDDVSSGDQALWDALTAGQGVVADTAAMLPDDDDDPMDVAA